MNILEMARPGLRGQLSLAIHSARSLQVEAHREGMAPNSPNIVEMLARPVPVQGRPSEYLMVIFKENPARETAPLRARLRKSENRMPARTGRAKSWNWSRN